jgi:hypothetical protein
VTSRIDFTSRPEAAIARIADSRPPPGPRTSTSTLLMPNSFAWVPAFFPATCAANGVPFLDPLNPIRPAEDQVTTSVWHDAFFLPFPLPTPWFSLGHILVNLSAGFTS